MRFLRNKFLAVWVFGLAGALTVLFLLNLPGVPKRELDTIAFDTYQRLKPRQWAGSDITVVDIDEASLKRVGQWPWPRSALAQLVDRLGQMGAAAIVFDMVFSEPDRTSPAKAVARLRQAGAVVDLPEQTRLLDNDQVFADAIARHTVITGLVLSNSAGEPPPRPKAGVGISGTVPPDLMDRPLGAVRNLPVLDNAATGIGHFTFDTDLQKDAVVRRALLLQNVAGQWYPSLAMETLRVVQGAGGFKLKSNDGSGEFPGGELALVSAQVGALEIPTDRRGAIVVYHSPVTSKPVVSAVDIMFPAKNESDDQAGAIEAHIANHIVLIGTSAEGLLDLRATPLHPVVPGVTIHAEIIDQVIAGDQLSRPDIAAGVEIALAIVAVLILLALMPILNSFFDAVLALALSGSSLVICWLAFADYGLLFSPVLPVLAITAAYGGAVAADLLLTEKEGRFVRQAFGHYLAPALVERLADDPSSLTLGGEDRELTLLFCDIRGFTSLSEGLGPTELTELLNNFLTPMTDALLQRGATIDKYMGDAIMAFWNAPIMQSDHRQRACLGLLAMRRELEKLNEQSRRPIRIGIGLNTGLCCVGNLGSSQRFNYSAIGDAVNVASRVEGLTKQYGLDNLVAEETLEGVEGLATIEADLVGVVGREAPLSVHTILDHEDEIAGADLSEFQEAHREMIEAYRSADPDTAQSALEKAAGLAETLPIPSLKMLYELYEQRLSELRETGIPAGWDGVYRSATK